MALEFTFILALSIVYFTNYFLIPMEQYGVPILGIEIISGMVFGSVFGVVSPAVPGYDFLVSMAALGLMIIMFDAGVELDPSVIRSNATVVSELGIMTFLFPFVAGTGFGQLLGLNLFASVLVGITVSTTSLGLIQPLLEDSDMMGTEDGQIILSVTVLNDVMSVVALAYGLAIISDRAVLSVMSVTAAVVFFLYIAPVHLGETLSSLFAETLSQHTVRFSAMILVGLAFIMEEIGIHAVLGSFFAGLLISEISYPDHDVHDAITPVVHFVAPAFFFFVGSQLPVQEFPINNIPLIIGVLILGIGGKFVGAYLGSLWAGVRDKTEYLLITSMPGRLSISVAAAEIGLRQGEISQPLYYAFIILSIVSVFLSVFLFKWTARRAQSTTPVDAQGAS